MGSSKPSDAAARLCWARSIALGMLLLHGSCTPSERGDGATAGSGGAGGAGAAVGGGGSSATAGSGGASEARGSGGADAQSGRGSGGSGGSGGGGARASDAGSTRDAGARDGGDDGPAVCSGCPDELLDPSDTTVRVHHVHLNVKSAEEAIAFYEKFFGAKRVRLNGMADALWADPLLFLLEEGEFEFSETLSVGFEHVGLGVADVSAWFEMASAQGVMVDPRNGAGDVVVSFPLMPGSTPFTDPEVDNFTFVYVRGPNSERIEVWSGLSRFRHAHFMTPDIDASVAWYSALLGVAPLLPMADPLQLLPTNAISLEGVQLNFLSPLEPQQYIPTDGQPLDHIAFSVQDLERVFDRAKQLNLSIVSEPALTALGFRSFFVRAPQEALLEFVEAGPVAAPQ